MEDQNYTLGRGKLYIGTRDRATGKPTGQEFYFGNVPEISVTTDTEKLEHFKSTGGLKIKDRSVLLTVARTLSFTTDNISPESMAIVFLGESKKFTQTQTSDAVDVFKNVTRGRYYQLGISDSDPMGVTDVTNVRLVYADASVAISNGEGDITTIDGVKTLPKANYELDLAAGRVYIEVDAPDLLGEVQIAVQYDVKSGNREYVISGDKAVDCTLRFISDNPEGDNWTHFWPCVQVTPNGDMALISDDWMTHGFSADLMQLNETTPVCISQRRPKKAVAVDVLYNLSVNATPGSVSADGNATSTISVEVTDADSQPVSSAIVLFDASAGTLSAPTGTTDADGKASVTIKSDTVGKATISVTVGSQTKQVQVDFTA